MCVAFVDYLCAHAHDDIGCSASCCLQVRPCPSCAALVPVFASNRIACARCNLPLAPSHGGDDNDDGRDARDKPHGAVNMATARGLQLAIVSAPVYQRHKTQQLEFLEQCQREPDDGGSTTAHTPDKPALAGCRKRARSASGADATDQGPGKRRMALSGEPVAPVCESWDRDADERVRLACSACVELSVTRAGAVLLQDARCAAAHLCAALARVPSLSGWDERFYVRHLRLARRGLCGSTVALLRTLCGLGEDEPALALLRNLVGAHDELARRARLERATQRLGGLMPESAQAAVRHGLRVRQAARPGPTGADEARALRACASTALDRLCDGEPGALVSMQRKVWLAVHRFAWAVESELGDGGSTLLASAPGGADGRHADRRASLAGQRTAHI